MHRDTKPTRDVGGLGGAARQAGASAGHALQEGAPWLTRAARLGYAARGVVYVTLALIALQAALGRRQVEGQGGALREIATQPAGRFLLVLIALGLFGYAAWRLIEAARGAEGEGSDAKGIGLRFAHAGSGLLYGSLGLQAMRLFQGTATGRGDEARADDWTARLMAMPWGRALVAIAGLGVLVYAVQQLRRAARGDVTRHLDLRALDASGRENIVRLGRFGIGARGVVFIITGGFLLLAARNADPSEATGLSGSLAMLETAPWGRWLMGLVALGLLAFGLFQIVHARYRQLQPVR
ncbi:MAG: DUF1206 domain-containing protein [Gemmatirosa sp.]